jgi:hypothetical protein
MAVAYPAVPRAVAVPSLSPAAVVALPLDVPGGLRPWLVLRAAYSENHKNITTVLKDINFKAILEILHRKPDHLFVKGLQFPLFQTLSMDHLHP